MEKTEEHRMSLISIGISNAEPEDEEEKRFWQRIKRENAVRRRYYALCGTSRADFEKLKKWLAQHDQVEISTGTNGTIMLFNKTRVDRCRNPGLFHPEPQPQKPA